MSGKGILTKAIEKAIADGWVPAPNFTKKYRIIQYVEGIVIEWWEADGSYQRLGKDIEGVIFNHDFAAALFPGTITVRCGCNYPDCNGYQEVTLADYHRQKMVVLPDDERIKYLGAHL